jgi:prepilin peptidase CpaA
MEQQTLPALKARFRACRAARPIPVAADAENFDKQSRNFFFEPMTVPQIAAVVLVLFACVPDLRTRRIPNALTFGAALTALLFHGVTGGWSGLLGAIGGWLLGAALFFPIFALRGMGAGDVKLLAAVGAWLGPAQVIWVALITSVAGGILGLAVSFGYGYGMTAIRNVSALLLHWRVVGLRPLPQVTLEVAGGPRLAYAIPIAVGTMVTLWLK